VQMRLFVNVVTRRRAAAAAAGIAGISLFVGVGGIASAAPQTPSPTITQVQQKIEQLQNQESRLDQQFDQVKQELTSANQRLKLVNRQESRYQKQFQSMRASVAQIAATAYEDGTLTSPAALLTSGNPQQVLNQSSILLEMSANNNAAIQQFLTAAKQLTGAQQSAKRVQAGIASLKASLTAKRNALNSSLTKERALLAQLTPKQRSGLGPGNGGGGGGSPSPPPGGPYKGPTGTQAGKAVAYAYAQLGKPYVYGATGPSSFDCSGLTMASWGSAGISIPRVSYSQMSDLPSVSTSDLQPGDILGFAGNSHVGIYVGGGYLIDAPHTGADVEKVALSGWYRSELDGAVRP
jgi:cell wall-associated NlpC family hydrolase